MRTSATAVARLSIDRSPRVTAFIYGVLEPLDSDRLSLINPSTTTNTRRLSTLPRVSIPVTSNTLSPPLPFHSPLISSQINHFVLVSRTCCVRTWQTDMGSNNGRTTKLSLVPLPKGSVLLPGVTLRIPVSNRPDLANLLSSILDRTSVARRDGNVIAFGCVPLGSPFLSKDGQQLLDNGNLDDAKKEDYEAIDAGQARKEDLYQYGTVGKVIGVQRRAYSEPSLVVQGMQRFTINRVLKERPFFEAETLVHDDQGTSRMFPKTHEIGSSP